MSLHHGAKTKVGVGSELSEKFLVRVSLHQGSALRLFAIAVSVITKKSREVLINEMFYADDLVLMIQSIEIFKKKFL